MDAEIEALSVLEDDYSEELRNEAYALVLDQIGRFIERHKLRNTNFPMRANSALHILALGLAKNRLVSRPEEAERYLADQLVRIRDGGFDIVQEIFLEMKGIK